MTQRYGWEEFRTGMFVGWLLAVFIGASCGLAKVDPDLVKIQRQRNAMRQYMEASK